MDALLLYRVLGVVVIKNAFVARVSSDMNVMQIVRFGSAVPRDAIISDENELWIAAKFSRISRRSRFRVWRSRHVLSQRTHSNINEQLTQTSTDTHNMHRVCDMRYLPRVFCISERDIMQNKMIQRKKSSRFGLYSDESKLKFDKSLKMRILRTTHST